MSEKETGGDAFPRLESLVGESFSDGAFDSYEADYKEGMTLRDYAVLHGPWTISDIKGFHLDEDMGPQRLSELVVKWNNIYADYFIKERNK